MWEREAIGERTRDALNHKRSNGERVGNLAYGFRLADDGQHLEPDPAEQAAVAEIRRLRPFSSVYCVDSKWSGQVGSSPFPAQSFSQSLDKLKMHTD
jgi:hypothetical protein